MAAFPKLTLVVTNPSITTGAKPIGTCPICHTTKYVGITHFCVTGIAA